MVFGPIAGIAMGYVAAKLVSRCYRTQWMSESAEGMIALGLAFGVFALAELMHGNGFIAAFVAGSFLYLSYENARVTTAEFDEAWGNLLVYFVH